MRNVLFRFAIITIFVAHTAYPSQPTIIEHQPKRLHLFWYAVICAENNVGLLSCRSIYEHEVNNPEFDNVELMLFRAGDKMRFDSLKTIGRYRDKDALNQLLSAATTHGCIWCPDPSSNEEVKGFFLGGTSDIKRCSDAIEQRNYLRNAKQKNKRSKESF